MVMNMELDKAGEAFSAARMGSPEASATIAERARRLAHLAAVVETSGEAIISTAIDGRIITWNPAAERLFGYSEAEAVGRHITLIVPKKDLVSLGIASAVVNEGRTMRVRARRSHKSGESVPVSICVAPMRDEAGAIIGVSSIFRDISDMVRAEERQLLLVRELAHRGKNMLAVLQSIARRSLPDRQCKPEARDRLVERIAAMARTYQTMNAEGFEGAKLSELARTELEHFSSRADIDGPDVLLRTSEAQTFGLLLHELATNATKHGALSKETGRVSVEWRIESNAEQPRFVFDWIESGGPRVSAPRTSGFGMALITSVVEQSFSQAPRLEFLRAGFRYHLECPMARIGRRLESSSVRARIRSPRMRGLYDAWRRDGASMPTVEDIMPTLQDLVDNVLLVEFIGSAEPAEMRFIAAGKKLRTSGPRFDVTLGEGGGRDIPGTVEATYRRCARLRQPMYEFSRLGAGDPDEPINERLFLPCSADGKKVTHVVGMSIFNDME
jgi:PAS domain S-box-containing protein